VYESVWFTRVWVVQDVVGTRQATVLYGDSALSWDDLASLSSSLQSTHLYTTILAAHQLTNDGTKGISAVLEMEELRKTFSEKGYIPLPRLLETTQKWSCKLDVDRLHGIMTLDNWQIDGRVKVDYSVLVHDALLPCLKLVIPNHPILPQLLSQAGEGNSAPGQPS
jgi:hypothetical protein